MKDFRWNDINDTVTFWSSGITDSGTTVRSVSPKELIKNPLKVMYTNREDIIMSLCKIVSELVEIEEKRQT